LRGRGQIQEHLVDCRGDEAERRRGLALDGVGLIVDRQPEHIMDGVHAALSRVGVGDRR
jgi:hypothetical protein